MYDTLPTEPGALLGYRKNGSPIYLAAGGDETSDGGGDPPPDPAPAPQGDLVPPAAGGDPGGQPPADPPGGPQPSPQSVDQLPDFAQKMIRELRAENAKARTKSGETAQKLAEIETRQQQQMDAIAKALGLKQDDTADPEKLMEQLTREQQARETEARRAHQLSVELAVYRNAAAQGADGNKLLDSRTFLKSVEGLDPTMDDFESLVKERIADAVTQFPVYRATQDPAPPPPPAPPAIPRASGDFSSAPPQGPRQWTEEDVHRASASELAKAIDDGLLVNLGVGRPKGRR